MHPLSKRHVPVSILRYSLLGSTASQGTVECFGGCTQPYAQAHVLWCYAPPPVFFNCSMCSSCYFLGRRPQAAQKAKVYASALVQYQLHQSLPDCVFCNEGAAGQRGSIDLFVHTGSALANIAIALT